MLKKWLILVIVLSCTIFAVSSGCSEKGKGNNTQDATENNKESNSADTVEKSGETPSKDSGKETSMKIESTGSSGEKTETNIVSTGNSGDWCPVGSSWKTANPQTGEEVEMKVTGTETVDGISMCKAVYETNVKDDDVSRVEYLWSQDSKTYFWTAFDTSGKKVSEFSMKEGKMRMVDKDGKVTEITTQSS